MERILMIGALFFGIFVGVPVIAILAEHQRKMTKLMQENRPQNDRLQGEVAALRAEMHGIKDALNILALNATQSANVRERQSEPPAVPVQAR